MNHHVITITGLVFNSKKNICHRTGLEALEKIFDTGAILPNDGTLPDTYPQSKNSFARVHNLVPLFDFENQTKDECLKQIHNWYRFFFDHKPVTIVILEYIPTKGAFPGIYKKVDDFVKKHKEIYKDPLHKLEKELEK